MTIIDPSQPAVIVHAEYHPERLISWLAQIAEVGISDLQEHTEIVLVDAVEYPVDRRLLVVDGYTLNTFSDYECELHRLPYLTTLRQPGGPELVYLPGPRDLKPESPVLARAGELIRDEVHRHRDAKNSWCGAFGSNLVYLPLEGMVGEKPDDAGRPARLKVPSELDEKTAWLVWRYLLAAAGRVFRWAGGCDMPVGAHSLEVAALAVHHAQQEGVDPRLAAVEGATHDLHEMLPGVGDVPSPMARVFRRGPWGIVEHKAVKFVRNLRHRLRLPISSDERVAAVVKRADLDALAIECGMFFGHAPAWLGLRSGLAAMCVQRPQSRRTLRTYDSEILDTVARSGYCTSRMSPVLLRQALEAGLYT